MLTYADIRFGYYEERWFALLKAGEICERFLADYDCSLGLTPSPSLPPSLPPSLSLALARSLPLPLARSLPLSSLSCSPLSLSLHSLSPSPLSLSLLSLSLF